MKLEYIFMIILVCLAFRAGRIYELSMQIRAAKKELDENSKKGGGEE